MTIRRCNGMLVLVVAICGLLFSAAVADAAQPRCRGKSATIVVEGRSGKGTARRDVIVVTNRRGATVRAGGSHDLVCGGPGRDTLYGQTGGDELDGGSGKDVLRGGAGVDAFLTTRGDTTDARAGETIDGKRKVVDMKLRKGTRQLSTGHVLRIRGDANAAQTVTLKRGGAVPNVGSVLVMAISERAPGGLLGRVTRVQRHGDGSASVTTKPATLDEAYSTFRVSLDTTVAAFRSAGVSLRRNERKGLSCDRSGTSAGQIDLDLSKIRMTADLDTSVLSPYLRVDLQASPTFTLSLDAAGAVSCKALFMRIKLPIAGTPLSFSVKPELTLGATGNVHFLYAWRPVFSYTFARGRNRDLDERRFDSFGDIEISGEADARASFKVNIEVSVGDGRVGLGGDITPHLDGRASIISNPPFALTCGRLTGAIDYGLYAFADVFVRRWSFELARGTFLQRVLFDKCNAGGAGPPGGAGQGGAAPLPPAPPPPVLPPPPPALGGATQIAAGGYHSCALRSGATISCWGFNGQGELGDGTTTNSSTPVSVTSIGNATQIAVGDAHSCALRAGGSISCWGQNNFGPLGNGTTTASSTPVSVTGISDAVQITGGAYHSCALRTGGTVSCWGHNAQGALGDGTTTNSSTPVSVAGISDAIQISGGSLYSCALRAGGTISCWGYNRFGALGNGTTVDSPTPVSVSAISDATQVAAGGYHSCALRAGGTISCWGYNAQGELGDGTTTDSSTPVSVAAIGNATQASAHDLHSCALRSGGTISCWGNGGFGQLGDGTTFSSSTPVSVTAISNATQVAGGAYRSCALRAGGTVSCWGQNQFGALGDGTTTNSSTPVSVLGFP